MFMAITRCLYVYFPILNLINLSQKQLRMLHSWRTPKTCTFYMRFSQQLILGLLSSAIQCHLVSQVGINLQPLPLGSSTIPKGTESEDTAV